MLQNLAETSLTPANQNGIAQIMPQGISTKLATRSNLKLLQSAGREAIHDQCCALLTQTALEHTVTLSLMEAACYRTAPLGEIRYQRIVDSYVNSAIARIERW